MNATMDSLINALAGGSIRVIDLTQTLSPETPVIGLPPEFGASPPMSLEPIAEYDDRGPAWFWNTLRLGEHTGTHFDAPVHWITGRDLPDNACDTIGLGRCVGPACVIDVSEECDKDPDFLLEPRHIKAWEQEHGRIPARSWVLLRSGWSGRTTKESFINADDTGPHSPGPSPATVQLLAHERDVLGFGTETIGTDAGQAGAFDPPYPCHTIMHGAGKLGLASLRNLDRLPPTGSVVIAAPLKIKGGSGSPIRAMALVGD